MQTVENLLGDDRGRSACFHRRLRIGLHTNRS
jgi:hypothetical protein